MPRYIDADAFIEKFKKALETQEQYGLYNHAKITQYVIKAIENEPTADVVPKSEVERWRRNLEAVLEEIPETKREVAREIFEEIKEIGSFGEPIVDYICMSFDELAELKKKYTEGE